MRHLCTQHIAGGNMRQVKLSTQPLGLCAFSGTGCSQQNNAHFSRHGVIIIQVTSPFGENRVWGGVAP